VRDSVTSQLVLFSLQGNPISLVGTKKRIRADAISSSVIQVVDNTRNKQNADHFPGELRLT
jgi:hypothetical protein